MSSDTFTVTSHPLFRSNLRTIIICLLAILIMGQPYGGFLLVFFIPFALLYQLISLLLARCRPAELIRRCVSIVIILLAGGTVFLIHFYRYQEARQAAETVREAIAEYRTVHQHYPVNLNEISPSIATSAASQRIGYYSDGPDRFSLFYKATEVIYEVWHYDSSTDEWKRGG